MTHQLREPGMASAKTGFLQDRQLLKPCMPHSSRNQHADMCFGSGVIRRVAHLGAVTDQHCWHLELSVVQAPWPRKVCATIALLSIVVASFVLASS